jgi:hypothetical protein
MVREPQRKHSRQQVEFPKRPYTMPNRTPNPEVSDTTDDDSSNTARPIKISFFSPLSHNLSIPVPISHHPSQYLTPVS